MKICKRLLCLLLTGLLCLSCLAGCSKAYYDPPTMIPVETIIPEITDPEKNLTPQELEDSFLVENLTPYSGPFMECDPEYLCRVENIYALRITNISDKTVLNAVLNYNDGQQELSFYFEVLPPGVTVVVSEMEKTEAVSETMEFTGGAVNFLEPEMEYMDAVEITPTENSTLEVKNVSDEALPIVWVFYRDRDRFGDLLGGRCFSCMTGQIEPGKTYEVEAESWLPSCEIIDVVVLHPSTDQ